MYYLFTDISSIYYLSIYISSHKIIYSLIYNQSSIFRTIIYISIFYLFIHPCIHLSYMKVFICHLPIHLPVYLSSNAFNFHVFRTLILCFIFTELNFYAFGSLHLQFSDNKFIKIQIDTTQNTTVDWIHTDLFFLLLLLKQCQVTTTYNTILR